jgi:hypothetical protein
MDTGASGVVDGKLSGASDGKVSGADLAGTKAAGEAAGAGVLLTEYNKYL